MGSMKRTALKALTALLLGIHTARAHCPLCTAAIAAGAGGAAVLGVNNVVIGLLVGAFAVSTGWWAADAIKKRVVPYQKQAIIVSSFLLTVLPLSPFLSSAQGVNVFVTGSYGSPLYSTYLIDRFLVGALLGGTIVSVAPWLSSSITALRSGRRIPYQGILLTIALLLVAGAVLQAAA